VPVLEAILNEQKEIMLQLLGKIENKRTEIEILALDDDFQSMETDDVALKMSVCTQHGNTTPLITLMQRKLELECGRLGAVLSGKS
jgi:hypothetical protein